MNLRFSRYEFIQTFAFCVIATHSWTIINMFRDVASWSLSVSIWDLIGSVSYTLISLLFETLVFFLFIVTIGFLLPRRWIGDRYVTLSGLVVIDTTILAIVVKTHLRIGFIADTLQLFAVLIIAMILIAILCMRINRIEEKVRRICRSPKNACICIYIRRFDRSSNSYYS